MGCTKIGSSEILEFRTGKYQFEILEKHYTSNQCTTLTARYRNITGQIMLKLQF